MSAVVENGRKAKTFRSRADNIQSALDHAIYSDDENALEALAERITKLEAQRDTIKAKNAEYRKAHTAELKALTFYGRDQVLPFPSWRLTNLTADIARNRKRLAQLTKASA